MTTWLVTRHAGARVWAARLAVQVDRVVDHLELDEVVNGDTVVGSLPINLVAELNDIGVVYYHLTLPLTMELRGTEITANMMEKLGAKLERYRVERE